MPRRTRRSSPRKVGGRVLMPSEYFGRDSGRYFPEGSPQLMSSMTAYGMNIPTSRGTMLTPTLMGPSLAPAPNSTMTQTGGKRTSHRRRSSYRRRRSSHRRMRKF
jgi:hypothetical protein